jgi:UDP-GlcNAc3NAcA epimerase
LAAVKLHIPLAHVEAGLRSYNREMPEEHNRVLTDHCSNLLFCPTQTAVDNLEHEGITKGVNLVGDPMYDAVIMFGDQARRHSTILQRMGLHQGRYILTTIHRAYNTDNAKTLGAIFSALTSINEPVIFPVHPRTRQKLQELGLIQNGSINKNLKIIDPVGYLDMLTLEQSARLILTDSGGVQKEAFFFAVPCLTLRPETEWVETVHSGWNLLVGTDTDKILAGLEHSFPDAGQQPKLFGDGRSADAIRRILEDNWKF